MTAARRAPGGQRLLGLAMAATVLSSMPVHAAPVEACGPSGVVADRVVVDGAPESVRKRLVDGLTTVHERDDPFYRRHGFATRALSDRLTWQAALGAAVENPLFADRWFLDPRHAQDVYVHFMGQTIQSSGWCARGRPVETGVTYVLTLRADGPGRTEIVVATDESRVPVGKSFDVHAMGWVADMAPHEPAAADRYRMLVYAAHLAGTDLPPLEAPAAGR